MALSIRPAVVGDARDIAQVHVRGWQVAYKGLLPSDFLESLDVGTRAGQWRASLAGELTEDEVPGQVNVVAELDGAVVGFAIVGRYRDTPDDETAGELWAMYVDPDCWGDGVGDALMAFALEELERQRFAPSFLWVLEGNARARRFYERHGWTLDDAVKTFEVSGVTVPEVRYSRSVVLA